MAATDITLDARITALRDQVARAVGRNGIRKKNGDEAAGVLKIRLENGVRRVVKVYWTPFSADVPGRSISLYLEIKEPKLWWAECYLSPDFRNWVFCFSERPDGEIQLTYYRDYATTEEALEGFFDLTAWYVLTPADKSWSDIVYDAAPELEWEGLEPTMSANLSNDAIQESLKKSTIIWLRWTDDGVERTMPVWFLNDKGTIYVLSGERQQTIPNVQALRRCDVIFRWKGKNTRVGEVPASVRLLDKGPGWDEIAEKIAEKRLNIPGAPEDTARRWRDECEILELTLIG